MIKFLPACSDYLGTLHFKDVFESRNNDIDISKARLSLNLSLLLFEFQGRKMCYDFLNHRMKAIGEDGKSLYGIDETYFADYHAETPVALKNFFKQTLVIEGKNLIFLSLVLEINLLGSTILSQAHGYFTETKIEITVA